MSIRRRARVSVPATSANLGPGFDAIGVALDMRGEVELSLDQARPGPSSAAPPPAEAGSRSAHPRLVEGGPTTADRGHEMALDAVERVFRHLGRPTPSVQVSFHSDVPVARGLGASAIVRAGAAVAAFALAGMPDDREWVLGLVSELEGHADNAAPALLGGLQVVALEGHRVVHVQVPLPARLRAVLFVPDFEMSTDEGRRLLPSSLSRADAVHNSSRAALLVAGLATGRLDVLETATDDRLHQPARSKLFPAMYDIFRAATDAGALCAFLSGGGSSILAIAESREAEVADAMARAASYAGVTGHARVTGFSERGAEIVSVD